MTRTWNDDDPKVIAEKAKRRGPTERQKAVAKKIARRAKGAK